MVKRFVYTTVTWPPGADENALVTTLNQFGADGWEAIGLAPRGASVPMPGMGAKAVPDVIVILKREVPAK